MKNIYMVQVGFSFDKSVYLPYSVAAIISYCKSIPAIREKYSFPKPIYKRDKIADIVSSLDAPYMVGFSCYLWNTNFNMELAKAVKENKAIKDVNVLDVQKILVEQGAIID